MNNKNLMDALNDIDADLIAHAEKTPSPIPVWVRLCAAAACICLIIGATLALIPTGNPSGGPPTNLHSSVPTTVPSTPNTSTVTTHPTVPTTGSTVLTTVPTTDSTTTPTSSTTKPTTPKPASPIPLTGSSLEFIVGSSTNTNNPITKPIWPGFNFHGLIVQAKVASVLPDTYYKLEDNSKYNPLAYRVLKMRVLSVINGKGIGTEFLYMLPESMMVDFSVYDCLLISMTQLGAEGYVLRNASKNQIEAFSGPMFGHREIFYRMHLRNYAAFGEVIAFRNGVFDVSLWESPGWDWAQPPIGNNFLQALPGSTPDQVIELIRARTNGSMPTVLTLQFTTPEAKAAYEYVKPFVNGVFAQEFSNGGVTFRRFINGCSTEEKISIRLKDEQVTYSDVRYTAEELANIEDISVALADLACQYAVATPAPPHTTLFGEKLQTLMLFAWYVKVDENIYGIIKTAWVYTGTEVVANGKQAYFLYDDSYRLFDGAPQSGRIISRNDLLAITDSRHVHRGEYNNSNPIPTV